MHEHSSRQTLSAAQAAERLGVSRQTLYAYVSRGFLRAHAADDSRQSRYLAAEVERLAQQRATGRKPTDVAKGALNFGTPVLSSAITLIADGKLYYRGQDAVGLAGSTSVEAVAALLWDLPFDATFAGPLPCQPAPGPAGADSLLARFAAATTDDATATWQRDPARLAAGAGQLLRLQAACLLGRPPSAVALHLQCADAWGVGPHGAELIRMALILSADHELNASSFTARCVASTGASLRAAVIGGLAALSGPLHGGTTARIETFWDAMDAAPRPEPYIRQALAGGEVIPGFGHTLYPDGDVRATALLAQILPHRPDWRLWIQFVEPLIGQRPNVDLALVALRRFLDLPGGSAFGLFALGRTVGWIAHALEQRADAQLIRPRAVYVGPTPDQRSM